MSVTVHYLEKEAKATEACVTCGGFGPGVYWGLAVIGIEYKGAAKVICTDCIEKIVQWAP